MAIHFFSEDIPFQLKNKRRIAQWLQSVISSENKKCGDIGYIFVSEEKILELNNKFLQHDYYTDIITFDNTVGDMINGEMYLSIDTIRYNSGLFEITFENELLRVIVHGVLHMCGYHDGTMEEQQNMRKLENKYLEQIYPE